jgi:hypothetical protein
MRGESMIFDWPDFGNGKRQFVVSPLRPGI